MNQNQKILLLVVMIVFAAVLIYPPFEIVGPNGRILKNGYSWIFDLPRWGRFLGSVNVPQLLIQWVGVLIVGGILFLVLQDKGSAAGNKRIESQNDKMLEGVGGWLAFLIFSLLVLSPLFSLLPLGGIYGEELLYPRLLNDPDWNALKDKFFVVIFIAVILYLSAGWVLLRRRHPDAVTFAITTLWVGGPFASAVLALGAFNGDWGKVASALIVTIPHAVIWTAYLRKSIRVRNTYCGESNLTPPQSSALSQTPKPKPSEFVNEQSIVTQLNNEAQLTENNTNEQVFSSFENQHPPKILSDDALYEMAWKETELNNGDRGLWAKAYAVCDGEMEKTRAYYIRERVKFLQGIQDKRLDGYNERKVEKEEKNKRNYVEKKIRKLRAYRKIGAVYTYRNEARRILDRMGVNYSNFIQNTKNITPLMLAVGEGDKSKVELLLLAGADPKEKTTYGETAYIKARKLKHDDIALIIESYSREKSPTHLGNSQQKRRVRAIVIVFFLIFIGIVVGINVSDEPPSHGVSQTFPDSAEEQFNRGYMYYEGDGVEKDVTAAVNWWYKAALQGHAGAQNNLGVMYDQGEGIEQNSDEALQWWRKAAEQGEAYAQNSLGDMYIAGRSVKQSDTEALSWYQKSAAQGHATGQNNLGEMYYYGIGIEQNKAEAVKWYRKAANQGNTYAQIDLGLMYELGRGVEKNYAEAVNWYRKAADANDETGQTNLALMYAKGLGVPQDDAKAAELFLSAAKKGNSYAQFNLGLMTAKGRGVQKDIEQAINLYRQAAEQNHLVAQLYLAISYQDGLGVGKDKKESGKWFEAARKQEDVKLAENKRVITDGIESPPFMDNDALNWLGESMEDEIGIVYHRLSLMFRFGRGVIPDADETEMWSRKAAKQGYKAQK